MLIKTQKSDYKLKRLLNRLTAVLLLFILSLIFLAVAIAIELNSLGNILFGKLALV